MRQSKISEIEQRLNLMVKKIMVNPIKNPSIWKKIDDLLNENDSCQKNLDGRP